MQSLVKLHDLVEPPLGGSSAATTSWNPKGEAMELDGDNEEQEEDMLGVQHIPGEVNLKLG